MALVGSSARRLRSALAGLSVMLAAGQAHAFCREVGGILPVGYDPTPPHGCYTTDPEAGVLPQLFWRNQCVNYNLNELGTKLALSDVRRVASQAFAQWSGVACPGGLPSILATEGQTVLCSDQSAAHNNPIIFRDNNWPHADSANAIGYTTLTVNFDTGEILGAEIEINTAEHAIVATSPAPDGAYDLASILTHEAGHFLGLAHSGDSSAVMYAFYHANSTSLRPDDVAGICQIYPSNGSRNTLGGPVSGTSCDPAPILGFERFCGALDASALPQVTTPAMRDGGTDVPAETVLGCALEPAARSGPAGAAAASLLTVGLLARRARRTCQKRRGRHAG